MTGVRTEDELPEGTPVRSRREFSRSEIVRGGSLQRRTLWVLSTATILGGLGVGATLSVGALLLAEVSGNDAISGLASSVVNAGAAIAGIPLARLAMRHGRRRALVTGSLVAMVGALVAILATAVGQWVLLAAGLALLGVASAVQLLSRFTATDLALPGKRARDLSLVVWSITVGAVVGPNLIGPGAVVGAAIGVAPLAGVFVFAFVAQVGAAAVNFFGLRPDPLLAARRLPPEPAQGAEGAMRVTGDRGARVLTIVAVALAQAVMVALMAMTPLHLMHHDGTPEIVGVTLSLHIAGMFAFSPLLGSLAGRIGRLPVIALGWALLMIATALAFVAGSSHLLVQISLTLLGLGWGAITVAGAALLTELTPEPERPRWQGRSDTIMSASGAVAGALSGVVFAAGDFSLLAVLGGVLVLFGILASLWQRLRPTVGGTQ